MVIYGFFKLKLFIRRFMPTQIKLLCVGMTLNQPLVLGNPPMWLNYKNPAKKSGQDFLHSDVKDSLLVITNA